MAKRKTAVKKKAAPRAASKPRPKAVKVRLDLPSASGHFGAYGG